MYDFNDMTSRISSIIEPVVMRLNPVEFYELTYPSEFAEQSKDILV